MNRRLVWPLAVLLIAVLLWGMRESLVTDSTTEVPAVDVVAEGPANAELQSLDQATETMAEFTVAGGSFDELNRVLQERGQDPFLASETIDNEELNVIRLKNPPVGIQDFDARYAIDSSGRRSLRRVGFIFRGGASSFNDAIRAVRAAYHLPEAEPANGLVKWETPYCELTVREQRGEDPGSAQIECLRKK